MVEDMTPRFWLIEEFERRRAGSMRGSVTRRTPSALSRGSGMSGVVGRERMPKPMLMVTGTRAASTMRLTCSSVRTASGKIRSAPASA
jgi:hypothetical protein